MFLGTGKLEVRLMNPDGTVVETIVCPRPTERIFEDFEDIYSTLPTNVYGQAEDIFEGVRFRLHARWVCHANNIADMAKIRKIGNWRIGDQFVNLWPHADQPQIQLRCKVRKHPTTPVNGKTNADIMELEFVGMDTLERMPNPLYDRVGKLFRRGSVNTAARSFGT